MKTKTLKRLICPNGAIIPSGTIVTVTPSETSRAYLEAYSDNPEARVLIRCISASNYFEGFLDIVGIKDALEASIIDGAPPLSLRGEQLEDVDKLDSEGFPSVEAVLLY
jgi:hypothetical protein